MRRSIQLLSSGGLSGDEGVGPWFGNLVPDVFDDHDELLI
jgi:hypothetical protein